MNVTSPDPGLPDSSPTPKPRLDSSPHEHTHEISPLLPKSDNDPDEEQRPADGEIRDLKDHGKAKHVFWEIAGLFKASVPVFLAYALQNSLQTVSVVIVGRGPPEDLATAAFAYMFAMCTAWLIALGGTTALDTLGSSTFTGSKDPHDLGVLLQRAFVVLTLFYVPVAVLWGFSEPVFKLLGQEAQLSRDSAKFLQCLIPGGIGYIYFECMKKYLQSQGLDDTGHLSPWTGTDLSQRSCGQEHMSC